MPTREEIRRAQEQAYPERFSDGAGWLALAERALTLKRAKAYTLSEWERITGRRVSLLPAQIIAAGLYELRPQYEEERLRAQMLTLEADARVEARAREIADMLRRARTPDEIAQRRAALEILIQARKVPARRLEFGRLVRTLGLEIEARDIRPRR